jgi:hypothetical protein
MRHRRKLANNTWGGDVRKIDHGHYLNFRGIQIRKAGGGEGERNFSTQSLLYIHLSPHSHSNFFICPSPTVAKGKLFLNRKYFFFGGGGICPPCPPVTPMTPGIIRIRCKTAGYMINGTRKAIKLNVKKQHYLSLKCYGLYCMCRWTIGIAIANGLQGAVMKVDTAVFTSTGTEHYGSHKHGKQVTKPTFLTGLCVICTPEDDHIFGRPWQQLFVYILDLHILILVWCNVGLHYTNTNQNYFSFVLVFMKTIDIKLHRYLSGTIGNLRWRKLTYDGEFMFKLLH